jgi:hypothetical protein
MSSFFVDLEYLPGLSDLLERFSDDTSNGIDYIINNTGLDGGYEGWLNEISGAHDYVIQTIQTW